MSYYIYEVERASYVRGGMTPPPLYIGSRNNHHGRRHIASYKSKVRYAKTKKETTPAAAMILFSYLFHAGSIYRVAGATPQTLLDLFYIAPRVHYLRGIFLSAGRPGRGSRILKMRHEKTRRKVSIKNTAKKIFIFLIILHIKYEDKKTSRRQNIKK